MISRMVSRRTIKLGIALFTVIGISAWVCGYIIVFRSDAFAFARTYLAENSKVTQAIGSVDSSRLGYFNYSLIHKDGDESAKFKVVLKGDHGSGDAYLELERSMGVWKVKEGNLILDSGSVISLSPNTK